jgi:hypothetical protein
MCENAKDKKYMNIANFPEKGKYNVQCPRLEIILEPCLSK